MEQLEKDMGTGGAPKLAVAMSSELMASLGVKQGKFVTVKRLVWRVERTRQLIVPFYKIYYR